MPKKVIPPYPAFDGAFFGTVAVRLSGLEMEVLDYMVKNYPGDHSRGGLLRAIFRGVVSPGGLIANAGNVKELRAILEKSALEIEKDGEIQPVRVIVCLSPGLYVIKVPLVSKLNYWVLGSRFQPSVVVLKDGGEIDLNRFKRCQIEYASGVKVITE